MNAFTHNRHGLVRVPWRIVIYSGLVLASILGLAIILGPLLVHLDLGDEPESLADIHPLFLTISYAFLIAIMLLAGYLMTRFYDRRSFAGLGLGFHTRWKKEFTLGLLLSAGMITMIVMVQYVAGSVRFSLTGLGGGEILRDFSLYAIMFTAVAFMEEILFRGYLLQTLAEGIGRWPAAILLSFPFGILHFYNEGGTPVGALSTGLAGLLLSFAYFRTRSLWLPAGMHITWNFFTSWVFALPASGERLKSAPLRAEISGPEWLSGGSFGPEGSVLCFVAMGLMALLIYRSRAFDPSPEATLWFPPPEERVAETVSDQWRRE